MCSDGVMVNKLMEGWAMVPKGWKTVELGSLVSGRIQNGYSPNSPEKATGYWVLSLAALKDDGLNVNEVKFAPDVDKVKQAFLRSGDFLISRSNTPDKVGRSGRYVGEHLNISYPDLMMRFRANEDLVDADFLELYLKSTQARWYFRSRAAGSSNTMVKLNKDAVASLPILLPYREEQIKIARILSTWGKAIEIVEKLIANSRQQKSALMQQLLTGRRRFQQFNTQWKSASLADTVEIVYGKSTKEKVRATGKFPVIGTSGVMGWSNAFLHDKLSVVIGRKGTIDKPQLLSQPFWPIDTTFYCVAKPNIDMTWFYHMIKNLNLRAYSEASGVPSLSRETLYKIKIDICELKEQQKIAAVLSNADAVIKILNTQLTYLQQEKKALMQSLLTGKRRVTLEKKAA